MEESFEQVQVPASPDEQVCARGATLDEAYRGAYGAIERIESTGAADVLPVFFLDGVIKEIAPAKAPNAKYLANGEVSEVELEDGKFTRVAGDFWKDAEGQIHQFAVREVNGRLEQSESTSKLTSEQLVKIARERISSEQVLNEFLKLSTAFDATGHSSEVKEKCNYQLARILAERGSTGKDLNDHDLAQLAVHGLRDLTYPEKVGQGNRGTCVAAALETCMLRRDPVASLKFVADIALTRTFRLVDKTSIYFSSSDLKANKESQALGVEDGKISHFGQLFQFGAAKIAWLNRSIQDEKLREQLEQVPRNETAKELLGKRNGRNLVTYGIDRNGVEGMRDLLTGNTVVIAGESAHPFLSVSQVPELYERISGSRPEVISMEYGTKQRPGNLALYSLKDVPHALDVVQKVCGLPIVVSVRAGDGWHAVTVKDFKDDKVFLDNTWDADHDSLSKPLSANQFGLIMSGKADLKTAQFVNTVLDFASNEKAPDLIHDVRTHPLTMANLFDTKNQAFIEELSKPEELERYWRALNTKQRQDVLKRALLLTRYPSELLD